MGEDQRDSAKEEGEDERQGTCQHSSCSEGKEGEDQRHSAKEEVYCCRESETGCIGESEMG